MRVICDYQPLASKVVAQKNDDLSRLTMDDACQRLRPPVNFLKRPFYYARKLGTGTELLAISAVFTLFMHHKMLKILLPPLPPGHLPPHLWKSSKYYAKLQAVTQLQHIHASVAMNST